MLLFKKHQYFMVHTLSWPTLHAVCQMDKNSLYSCQSVLKSRHKVVTDSFIFLRNCQGLLLELRLMGRNPEEVSDPKSITPIEFCKVLTWSFLHWKSGIVLKSLVFAVLVVEQKSAAQNPLYLPVQSWFILLMPFLSYWLSSFLGAICVDFIGAVVSAIVFFSDIMASRNINC